MQKVLTAEQMRTVDRLTTEKYGIPSILLMESAAHAVARVITEKLGGSVKGKSILILCGKGNNGGDGAAVARILWTQGSDVEVCLVGSVQDTKGDARTNFEILQEMVDREEFGLGQADVAFEVVAGLDEWLEYEGLNFHADADPDVIVDALFGTGLTRPLEDVYAKVADFISAFNAGDGDSGTFVVSIDLPSGLDSDRAERIGANPNAHATITFTAPKAANVLSPAADSGGRLVIANIGSPPELIDEQPSQLYVTEAADAAEWLSATAFTDDSYKNKRGHALMIAGSESYSGAAVLCGNAAMRSGVGLVTIATPRSSTDSVASRVLPEVMVRGVAETESGSIDEAAFDELNDLLEKADSVAIGSGISLDESTKRFVEKVLANRRQTTIVDADALTLLSPFGDFAANGESQYRLILTPHEGEFMRLLETSDKETIKDRVAVVRDFATKHNVILVLKGERVLIGAPNGDVVVNPTGNSGLGKAGNGDTLTGILVGFVAQAVQMKIDIFETVVAAVYISGLAGDIAEKKYGKRVMSASDVRECLTEAFESLKD